jgi:hypothetical protein
LINVTNCAFESAFQVLGGWESIWYAFGGHERLNFLGFMQCKTIACAQQYSVAPNVDGCVS